MVIFHFFLLLFVTELVLLSFHGLVQLAYRRLCLILQLFTLLIWIDDFLLRFYIHPHFLNGKGFLFSFQLLNWLQIVDLRPSDWRFGLLDYDELAFEQYRGRLKGWV